MNIITTSVIISKTDTLDEYATQIEINDLGGGEFIVVTQPRRDEGVGIEAGEWPYIRAQIDKMFADIESRKSNTHD